MANCIDKIFCDNSDNCNVRITDYYWNDIDTRYISDGDEIYLSVSDREGYNFNKFVFRPDNGDPDIVVSNNPTGDGRYEVSAQCGGTYVAVFKNNVYQLEVSPNTPGYGTVYGSGSYLYGTSVVISATPNIGYHFIGWYIGNNFLSDTNVFEYVVKSNTSIVGRFEGNTYSIVVKSNNASLGTTNGTGLYGYNEQVPMSAIPTEIGQFLQWDDGETTQNRTIQVLQSAIYTANFEPKVCSVTINVECEDCNNSLKYGFVTGSGSYVYGTYVTVKAYPEEGFLFNRWTSTGSLASTDAEYSFIIEDDVDFTAFFEQRMCSFEVLVLPENSGSIYSGNNPFTYGLFPYGTTVTLKAVALGSNEFLRWEDGDTSRVKDFEMTTDIQTNAYFLVKPNTYEVIAYFKNSDSEAEENGGYVVITETLTGRVIGTQLKDYTKAKVTEGKDITITAIPAYGYRFDHWDSDTLDVEAVKIVSNVSGNIAHDAYFETIPE